MLAMIAAIPSPTTNQLQLGPLRITFYGILIGIGIAAGVMVVARRYRNYGGDPRLVERVALWGVLAGLVGARLAWVSTHSGQLDSFFDIIAVWNGGLAFFGGIFFGAVAGIIVTLKYNGDVKALLDSAAIGIPLAQAIGRWGNYANQELYGRPTTLPWGLEIAPAHRVPEYAQFATFHPTFLYESLWNVVIIIVLILIDRTRQFKRGNLFLGYLVMVGFGRFFSEMLRTDTTFRAFGISRNGWVSILIFVVAGIWLVVRQNNDELDTWEGVEPWTDADTPTKASSDESVPPAKDEDDSGIEVSEEPSDDKKATSESSTATEPSSG